MEYKYRRSGELAGRTVIHEGDSPTNLLGKDQLDMVVQPEGTRLVSLGENIESPVVNRALLALAANCDFLKSVFERNIAEPHELTLDNSEGQWTGQKIIDLSQLLPAGSQVIVDPTTESGAARFQTMISILDENYDEIIVLPEGEPGYGYGYGYGAYGEKLQVVDAYVGEYQVVDNPQSRILTAGLLIETIYKHKIKAQNFNFENGNIYPGCWARIYGSDTNNGWYIVSKVTDFYLELGPKIPDPSEDDDPEFWKLQSVKDAYEQPTLLNSEDINKGNVQVHSDGWFYHRPKLYLNIEIPDVPTVRILFGLAAPFAWLGPDTLMKVKVRAAEEVAASTQKKIWKIKWGPDAADKDWDEDLPDDDDYSAYKKGNLFDLFTGLDNFGLDKAYDKRAFVLDNKGQGRHIYVDSGAVELITGDDEEIAGDPYANTLRVGTDPNIGKGNAGTLISTFDQWNGDYVNGYSHVISLMATTANTLSNRIEVTAQVASQIIQNSTMIGIMSGSHAGELLMVVGYSGSNRFQVCTLKGGDPNLPGAAGISIMIWNIGLRIGKGYDQDACGMLCAAEPTNNDWKGKKTRLVEIVGNGIVPDNASYLFRAWEKDLNHDMVDPEPSLVALIKEDDGGGNLRHTFIVGDSPNTTTLKYIINSAKTIGLISPNADDSGDGILILSKVDGDNGAKILISAGVDRELLDLTSGDIEIQAAERLIQYSKLIILGATENQVLVRSLGDSKGIVISTRSDVSSASIGAIRVSAAEDIYLEAGPDDDRQNIYHKAKDELFINPYTRWWAVPMNVVHSNNATFDAEFGHYWKFSGPGNIVIPLHLPVARFDEPDNPTTPLESIVKLSALTIGITTDSVTDVTVEVKLLKVPILTWNVEIGELRCSDQDPQLMDSYLQTQSSAAETEMEVYEINPPLAVNNRYEYYITVEVTGFAAASYIRLYGIRLGYELYKPH